MLHSETCLRRALKKLEILYKNEKLFDPEIQFYMYSLHSETGDFFSDSEEFRLRCISLQVYNLYYYIIVIHTRHGRVSNQVHTYHKLTSIHIIVRNYY